MSLHTQTDRQTDGQTDRQTDRRTGAHESSGCFVSMAGVSDESETLRAAVTFDQQNSN